MAKKETKFDKVFEVYELKQASKDNKDKMRGLIQRHFEKAYGNKKWFELSKLEKDRFVYVLIRDKMLEHYIDQSRHRRINSKIDSFLNDTLLNASIELNEYNDLNEKAFEVFYIDTDSDSEKEKKYGDFCSVLSALNSKVPVPTFEEWLKQNKEHPLRAYDYCMSFYQEINEDFDSEDVPVSQSEVDHIVIKILLKILEEKHDIKIDTDLIRETLSYTKNFSFGDFDALLTTYDSSLNLTKDEQEAIIELNKKYVSYKKMLNNLNFYEK